MLLGSLYPVGGGGLATGARHLVQAVLRLFDLHCDAAEFLAHLLKPASLTANGRLHTSDTAGSTGDKFTQLATTGGVQFVVIRRNEVTL